MAVILAIFFSAAVLGDSGFSLELHGAVHGTTEVTKDSLGRTLSASNWSDEDAKITVQKIQKEAAEKGATNSILAQFYVFVVASKMFIHRPLWGYGLTVAHSIAPHNNFLLFAVAYGAPGLLIPILLVAVLAFQAGLIFAVTVLALMMFSHDIQLMMGMAVLIGISMGGKSQRCVDCPLKSGPP